MIQKMGAMGSRQHVKNPCPPNVHEKIRIFKNSPVTFQRRVKGPIGPNFFIYLKHFFKKSIFDQKTFLPW